MAKLYYPERVEHDIAARDRAGNVLHWLTASVETVDTARGLRRVARGGRMTFEATAEGLRDYAETRVRVVRDFATSGQVAAEDVRAAVRDNEGRLLADIRPDGMLILPDDIDIQVRRRFIGMLNGGLPLAIREVDRGEYAAALATIGLARRLMDDLIREVAALATCETVGLSWSDVASALELPEQTAEQWYGQRAG